jgi:hypothetical protein
MSQIRSVDVSTACLECDVQRFCATGSVQEDWGVNRDDCAELYIDGD